jgi:hypothetical protein
MPNPSDECYKSRLDILCMFNKTRRDPEGKLRYGRAAAVIMMRYFRKWGISMARILRVELTSRKSSWEAPPGGNVWDVPDEDLDKMFS